MICLGWNVKPPGSVSQRVGDGFMTKRSAPVLRVPSSIIPEEFNFLLNPLHGEFAKIKVSKWTRLGFDGSLKFL